jgi:hypothetical protein
VSIPLSFPILGSSTVSSDTVDPSAEGYRLLTVESSVGKTASEKVAIIIFLTAGIFFQELKKIGRLKFNIAENKK